jgi:hypothetical protein
MPILPHLKTAAFDPEPAMTGPSVVDAAWRVLRRNVTSIDPDQTSGAEGALDSTVDGEVDMSRERASDLARQCTELVRTGKDFPTLWSTLLKSHALVEGIPRQRFERNRSLLHIPLITGEQLVFDADIKEFRVQ